MALKHTIKTYQMNILLKLFKKIFQKDPKRTKSSIYDTVYCNRIKSSIYHTVYCNRIKISIYDTVYFKRNKSSIYHTVYFKIFLGALKTENIKIYAWIFARVKNIALKISTTMHPIYVLTLYYLF